MGPCVRPGGAPSQLAQGFAEVFCLAEEFQASVVVTVILEGVTNGFMGAEMDVTNEFEFLSTVANDDPTALSPLEASPGSRFCASLQGSYALVAEASA